MESYRHVACLITGREGGGVATILKTIAENFPEMLFICRGEGNFYNWIKFNNCRSVIFPDLQFWCASPNKNSISNLMELCCLIPKMHAASKKLEKLLQEESISIVHTHILPLHIQTGFLKGGFIKKVWHVHGAMNPKRFGGAIQWFYSTLADWGADLLVPVSNAVAKHYKPRKTPVEVLHNGAHLLQKDYPVRTYASPFKAIIAGVLVIDKGYHLAIEAIHKVRSEGIDVDLYICGGPLEGDYYKQLLSLVERLNLSKNVHFLGWRDDIRQLNSTMHFALHCYSKVEACPLWVIEAQLDGLPVISTRCGGPEELIVQGQTGFLVPSSDTDALALAIKNILHSSSTLNLMSRNAYAHAEKNFTEQVFVERMRNIYARLLQ